MGKDCLAPGWAQLTGEKGLVPWWQQRHSYQRGHVSSVHLATGNLLLGRWHAAHLEILRTRGSGAHDSRQGHRAVLHFPHPVILLL